jgi:site-specific recombinase XerD
LPAFREYLIAEGLGESSIRVYALRYRQAKAWCDKEGVALADISASEVRRLSETLPRSTSTQRQLATALRHFWTMVGRDNPPVKAIRVPHKPQYRNRALSPEQAGLLAKRALGWHPEGTAVMLGLYLALRASEIAACEYARFTEDFSWYTVTGKHARTYTLPVHPVLAEEVRMLARRPHNGHLFPGSRGRSYVTSMTVWNWVQRVADAAGVGKVEPHQLRHTAITTANDASGDLRTVAEFARHARIETTRLYTRVSDAQLRRVVDGIDYFGGG